MPPLHAFLYSRVFKVATSWLVLPELHSFLDLFVDVFKMY